MSATFQPRLAAPPQTNQPGSVPDPHAVQALKGPHPQTLLCQLVKILWQMVEGSTDGVLNLNEVSRLLDLPRRRINDVTNVLQGIEVLVKKSKHTFQGHQLRTRLDCEVQMLVEQEKKLDELIKTSREQVYRILTFLYLSYEDVKSIMKQTVIVVKAPAETVLEVPHPAESLQLYMKSTQGPIDVYLCSEDHSPSDVPDDHHDVNVEGHIDCSTDDSNVEEPPPTQSFLSMSSTDAVDDFWAMTMEQLPPLATQSVPLSATPLTSLPSPSHSSSSTEGEEKQSFATLTTPLALSLGGEEYLLSLGEDEGIADHFSVEPEGSLWKCLEPTYLHP
ncbi:Transcription factor E2F3 [Merluccius polli]|uniref:Transcription factor E2F3 n=1 Tax=Merluccius polli TaxID=89951 RepID=A0AA47MQT0_MERPO|nr:Transcription factor E2F3 [Merluccius polli]